MVFSNNTLGTAGGIPQGFSSASFSAGIKKAGNRDVAVFYSRFPAVTSAFFTRNQIKAAPVRLSQQRLPHGQGKIRAILVNSGNANACTGEQGWQSAISLTALVARVLSLAEENVVAASTGVIGEPLPAERLSPVLLLLPRSLSSTPQSFRNSAEAILTTDKKAKIVSARLTLNSKVVRIWACAKGSGMIHPHLATLLVFFLSDVLVESGVWRQITARLVERYFNTLSIDGETSTNDSIYFLANGAAGNRLIKQGDKNLTRLDKLLDSVAAQLREEIVRDGEGVSKLLQIIVSGARQRGMARRIAEILATSPLLKTAVSGGDPNWGRVMAALGRGPETIIPGKIKISFGNIVVARKGQFIEKILTPRFQKRLRYILSQPMVTLTVDLGLGRAKAEYLTGDITEDYIRINAHYRS